MPPLQLNEPIYRILVAQAKNIARIDTDVVIDGTDADGNQIQLWGPKPDIIRLYDTPYRFIDGASRAEWERIVTLAPLSHRNADRVFNRSDRTGLYVINCLVKLNQQESFDQRAMTLSDDNRTDLAPLAEKSHKLLYDLAHVLADDDDLRKSSDVADCSLVTHMNYDVNWDIGVQYPMALFTLTVECQITAYL